MSTKKPFLQVSDTVTREMISKAGNKMLFQPTLFHRGDGGVFPVEVMLRDGKPFAVGNYEIAPSSYEPGRYGMEFRPQPGERIAPAPASVAKAV